MKIQYRLLSIILFLLPFGLLAQQPVTWSENELMQPATLAELITKGEAPVIFNIGPAGVIKGAINIGSTNDEKNLQKLKTELSKLSSKQKVVIYCGCCPFANCPNVRPALALMKQLKFSNGYLLNIPKNLKTDWIAYSYPMEKSSH